MPLADIIVPLGTAAIGAVGGYLAAATHASSEKRRVDAENGRLREERDAQRHRARSEAYVPLVLTSVRLMRLGMAPTESAPDVRAQLLTDLEAHVSKVVVTGTETVRAAAEDFLVASQNGGGHKELHRLHGKLIKAIRRDVGAADPWLVAHWR